MFICGVERGYVGMRFFWRFDLGVVLDFLVMSYIFIYFFINFVVMNVKMLEFYRVFFGI